MTVWNVYTDGSAAMGAFSTRGSRHPGGWAAVVEHGHDGYVVRGRERDTTNVRMELTAVIRGLESIAPSSTVTVHTDSSVIFTVQERWARGILDVAQGKDIDLWVLLGHQLDRMAHVRLVWITKGGHPIHRRAHAIAGAEANALKNGLPDNVTALSRAEKRELASASRRYLVDGAEAQIEQQRRDRVAERQRNRHIDRMYRWG